MTTILSVIGLVTFAHDAHAYLDPGTASLILQGMIGGIAAAAAAATVHWQRVKHFFARMLGRGGPNGLASAKTDDE